MRCAILDHSQLQTGLESAVLGVSTDVDICAVIPKENR